MKAQKQDYDSPWKDTVNTYLREFLAFFFPKVERDIDWSVTPQPREKELSRILPRSKVGPRRSDILYEVRRLDGQKAWILIHLEIQAQRDSTFPKRMWTYNYRIHDLHGKPVVSL